MWYFLLSINFFNCSCDPQGTRSNCFFIFLYVLWKSWGYKMFHLIIPYEKYSSILYFSTAFLNRKCNFGTVQNMATESPKMLPVLNTLPSTCYTKTHYLLHLSWPHKHALKTWNQVTMSPFQHHLFALTWAHSHLGWNVKKMFKVTSEVTVKDKEWITLYSTYCVSVCVFPCMSRNQTGVILLNKTKSLCPFCVSRTHWLPSET